MLSGNNYSKCGGRLDAVFSAEITSVSVNVFTRRCASLYCAFPQDSTGSLVAILIRLVIYYSQSFTYI